MQLENGVGMVRQLLDAWRAMRVRLPTALPGPRHLTLACGTLIHPVLASIVEQLNTIHNFRVDLCPIENQLFGEEVTVSGLIAGEDLIGRLQHRARSDMLVLPRAMFDRAGTVTLDDVPVDAIARRLQTRLHIAEGIGDLERLIV